MNPIGSPRHRPALPGRPWLWLALILALGLALRAINLGRVPPGLWFDEALNGQDAWAVWHGGGFRLVYPDVFPREPLYVTLLALAVRVGGATIPALRWTSVLIGTLTLGLLYGALRQGTGRAMALTAAGVLATMRWHVLMSRLVFRTITLPAWCAGLLWAVWSWRRRPTAARAVLIGLLIGGGFYTYLAWYFMAPWVGGLWGWMVWRAWQGKAPRAHPIWMLGTALLVVAPLGMHYWFNPADLLSRPGAVSVFANGWAAGWREIARNTIDALRMFHWRGDHVAVQNVPHAAALDPIQGLFFAWGVLLCGWKLRRRAAMPAILLGWLGCGLLATIFTHTDSPNFLRTLVVAPAAAALTAVGLIDAARRLARRTRPGWGLALVVIVLLTSAAITQTRLDQWSRRADVWQKYQVFVVEMGRDAARQSAPGQAVFIPEAIYGTNIFQFMIHDRENIRPYRDASVVAPWPAQDDLPAPQTRFVYTLAGTGAAEWITGRVPGARLLKVYHGPDGRTPVAACLTVPERALEAGRFSGWQPDERLR